MRLGIDIGGTKTAAVVLDREGAVLASATAPSGRGNNDVVAQAAHQARRVVAEVGGPSAISSAGVCIPGLVDTVGGTVRHAVNLDVDDLDLGRLLGDALGIGVVVENDVKAAALGAHRLRKRGLDDTLAYLNLGTGLAAAVVHAGSVVRGVDGVAGEIGHIPVGGDVLCACGQTGCLETLASGTALLRIWPEAPDHGWDLFGRAAGGDGAAVLAAESLCHGVALAIQVLVLGCGAQDVVVSGGLTAMGDPLLEAIRAELRVRGEASPFLASLGLPDRVSFIATDVPVAAIGAAHLVRPAATTPEVTTWRS
ncbi:MAG: ROK family protein [Actinobacteria bacterium]|nr:ROK family protein [Actinomycetota bacterium]